MKDLLLAFVAVAKTYINYRKQGGEPVAFWCIWITPETGLKLKLLSELYQKDAGDVIMSIVDAGLDTLIKANLQRALGEAAQAEASPCD